MIKFSSKKWCIVTFFFLSIILISNIIFTIIVDPFFHYHKPLPGLQYPITEERYVNDGIVKNFDYDAIITGTSMTQNFKTTEFDNLWKCRSIKVPFSGGSYKEVNDNLQRAFDTGKHIKYVVRSIDYNILLKDKDAMNPTLFLLPEYLYDTQLLNDVNYVLNKAILFEQNLNVLQYTRNGGKTTSFDQYNNWNAGFSFGREAVRSTYTRPDVMKISKLTSEEKTMLKANLEQNVILIAKKYPDTIFYLFFTPYSIYYWDSLKRMGTLEKSVEAERIAIELMLEEDNIQLFSFADEYEMICDLNNYKDIRHYGEEINSRILNWMYAGEHLLTKENYNDYLTGIEDFYIEYDYEKLFID